MREVSVLRPTRAFSNSSDIEAQEGGVAEKEDEDEEGTEEEERKGEDATAEEEGAGETEQTAD